MDERDLSVLQEDIQGSGFLVSNSQGVWREIMCLCVHTQKNKPKYQCILSLKKNAEDTGNILVHCRSSAFIAHILHDNQHKLDPTPMNTHEYYTP